MKLLQRYYWIGIARHTCDRCRFDECADGGEASMILDDLRTCGMEIPSHMLSSLRLKISTYLLADTEFDNRAMLCASWRSMQSHTQASVEGSARSLPE